MRLVLLGAGGLSLEIESLAELLGHVVVGKITTDEIGKLYELEYDGLAFAVGSTTCKLLFLELLQPMDCIKNYVTLISPRAYVDKTAKVSPGCVIQHNSTIMPNVVIKTGTLINCNVSVGHGAVIGRCCTVNPGVNISGDVDIGDGVLVGTGSQILEKLVVEGGAIIGAGAVLTKKALSGKTYIGIPAKSRG